MDNYSYRQAATIEYIKDAVHQYFSVIHFAHPSAHPFRSISTAAYLIAPKSHRVDFLSIVPSSRMKMHTQTACRSARGLIRPGWAVRHKLAISAPQEAGDLANALRYTSQLKVSNREIASLGKEEDTKSTQPASKTPQKHTGPKKHRKSGSEDAKKTGDDAGTSKTKTNHKLLAGFQGKKAANPENVNVRERADAFIKKVKSAAPKILRGFTSGHVTNLSSEPLDRAKIPKLQHNLDRVLFMPGVQFLQDPRTRVYNFTPYLKNIIRHNEFDFSAIGSFVTVSKDKTLLEAASSRNKQFYSSTSSMTAVLGQFYRLLNNYNPENSKRFPFPKFTGANERLPASVLVVPKGKNPQTNETVYAVEADKSTDTEILLSAMGHCLETLLTTDEAQFAQYRVRASGASDAADAKPAPAENVYNYATYGDFLMRSQLDCFDERLPGRGTFDLKTRAVCSVRYDLGNPKPDANQYQIWKLDGTYESFQREYDDLIRTGALLKYAMQARIGQMDGIYVAYHNLSSFFGFQYLPLAEIDRVFYSQQRPEPRKITARTLGDLNDDLPSHVADTQFRMSLDIWSELMKKVIADLRPEYGDTAFRLVIKSEPPKGLTRHRMQVMVVPLSAHQVEELQRFPQDYQTGFREDITPQQRHANLKAHGAALNTFNERTAAPGVLLYAIEVQHRFGTATGGNYAPRGAAANASSYPRSKLQEWLLAYTIRHTSKLAKRYLQLLKVGTDMLALHEPQKSDSTGADAAPAAGSGLGHIHIEDPNNVMRAYLAIGAARMRVWELQEMPPVVYAPKN